MEERIQKILSRYAVASRRQAEQMMLEGRVTCNGAVCTPGQSADPDKDVILVDGRPLPSLVNFVYIMLHKPKGYVTTLSDEKGRKNVSQLVQDCGTRVYPVGRLDMDSEGLLLLTNDGDFANQIMHPRYGIRKTYNVVVRGYSPSAFEQLRKPIFLDGSRISTPDLALVTAENDRAQLRITIYEGKNRQVRRMCARAGMQVKRLVRVEEGPLELGDLPAGKWRYLTNQELRDLTHDETKL